MFAIILCVFFKTIFTFFAVYGLYNLIVDLCGFFVGLPSDGGCDDSVIVVKVKNHEDSLEGIIRTLLLDYLKEFKSTTLPEILIVDFGSDDSTPKIASALADDYSFIHYTTSELYIKAKQENSKE